ncbi:DNA polymerase zeta processivity subunit [Erysiphe necator]|uniref:Putative horma domain containing protein n=1 Tax=Uncinula necator TaxID=52586 RepID=A0A0B1NZE0_UNCNE|nr:DNA polymerase zeta processivity subunit [Erysiphe necator]KHJ31308.1 putative horma domain containing protein [Erysiphe necator]
MSTTDTPLLTNSLSLIQTFTSFLTVAFHSILFNRDIYPSSTFILTRAYNFPVRQSRHPLVCRWINDTISHLTPLLLAGSVARVVFAIFNDQAKVMERYMFNIDRFPEVASNYALVDFAVREGQEGREGKEYLMKGVPRIEIDEQLRATIRTLDYACSQLSPLPGNCTYTVAVELKDTAEPPIGNPQPWIPSEPSLQTGEKRQSKTIGSDLGGVKSVPVRLVEAGEFIMETWIEESKAKLDCQGENQI